LSSTRNPRDLPAPRAIRVFVPTMCPSLPSMTDFPTARKLRGALLVALFTAPG
jgi:hypothetical protein